MKLFVKILKSFASLNLFFRLCGLLGLVMLVGTLKPEWDIYHGHGFIGLLGLLAVNTIACVVSRWKTVPWPSLVSHFGILCILGGGATSLALGRSGQMTLSAVGPALRAANALDGKSDLLLPFKVRLKKFNLETYGQGTHEIYLEKNDELKDTLLVSPGKRYVALQGQVQIKISKFNPDFFIDSATKQVATRSNQPNNPALLVSFSSLPKKEFWVFQNFPGMHQENDAIQIYYAFHSPAVKQYKSEIEISDLNGKVLADREIWVNRPLHWAGYSFFQSSYDPDNLTLSILGVRRDPGTPMVYLGFAVLIFGLAWNALRRMA